VLRLCTECNTGYHWLPPLLQDYHRAHPGIEVRIAVEATDRPIHALLEGEIELAIVTSAVDDHRLAVSPLFRDELVAVMAPEHPLAARSRLEAGDFANQHLILYSAVRHDSYAFTRVLTPAGVEPRRVSAVPLTEAILEMVKAGLGISVLARWAIEPTVNDGTVVARPISRRGVFRAWSAVTLRSRPEPPWQRAFVELLARRAWPARTDTRSVLDGQPRHGHAAAGK
jgi:LysR family transcriptional regulator for metE and metH